MTIADCTVMVVEDHEFQRATTLQILANLGAGALLEAADAEGALVQFGQGRRPDVVICDLDMPGMDGIEFLRRVAQLGAGTAIIIASGLDGDVLRAAETTARGYGLVVLGAIPKPLTARRLLQAVGLHRPGGVPGGEPSPTGAPNPWAEALADERVGVRVRPRVELASGRLGGLEVRAHRLGLGGAEVDAARRPPERGPVALAVAERVAAAGLEALGRLADRGELVDVTLVLPATALPGAALVERLSALAEEAEVEPARICIAVSDAADVPIDLLTRLRVRGFGFGFDSFGASGATLPSLEPLPLTEVKIDATAVSRATSSERGTEAFAATVARLHDRGLDVICDGCVTAAEWMAALQAGCRRAQGAYVGPPLAPEDVTAWAASWAGVS